MKTNIRKLTAVFLAVLLLLSMTGCDSLDYREAVNLYNAQEYEAAGELFYELGDYEDSKQLYTRCQYWIAVELMEKGIYPEALPRFLKLGDYEDSQARAMECKYQRAIAAFGSGNLNEAETFFLDAPDYKQTPEYLRRITWQKFFDELAAVGTLQTEQEGKLYRLTADAETAQLVFFTSRTKDMDYQFYDDLTLMLSRDSTDAAFTATSTFTMGFKGSQIGSSQVGSGKVDITTVTADTVLVLDTYEKVTTDNLGKTSTTTDPAESLMGGDMAENFSALMSVIPTLLADSGISLTLQDIGFATI